MNADHEKTKRYVNSFKFLKYLSYGLCVVALAVGAVLWAIGNSKANDALAGASVLFVFAFIFSNAAGYHFNALSIIDLQKRLSELEAGSANDSKSES